MKGERGGMDLVVTIARRSGWSWSYRGIIMSRGVEESRSLRGNSVGVVIGGSRNLVLVASANPARCFQYHLLWCNGEVTLDVVMGSIVQEGQLTRARETVSDIR